MREEGKGDGPLRSETDAEADVGRLRIGVGGGRGGIVEEDFGLGIDDANDDGEGEVVEARLGMDRFGIGGGVNEDGGGGPVVPVELTDEADERRLGSDGGSGGGSGRIGMDGR